jgi:hypothetical protein
VICSGRLEYRVVVEPLHCYLHYTKHKQVWHSEPAIWRTSSVLDSEVQHVHS